MKKFLLDTHALIWAIVDDDTMKITKIHLIGC